MMIVQTVNAKSFNWKLTTSSTDKDPWGKSIQQFIKKVEGDTKGTVKITPYWGNKLGGGNVTLKQIQRGRIEMGGIHATHVETLIPESSLLTAPFIFTSFEERDCVIDNYAKTYFDEELQKIGLKVLSTLYGGTFGIASVMPVKLPSDLRNVKMRSQLAKNSILFFKSIGASPVPLDFPDFATSVQTGMIKGGGGLGPVYYIYLGFPKLMPYFVYTQHQYTYAFILMNLKSWNQLDKSQQGQIIAALPDANKFREMMRGMEASMLEKYIKQGGHGTFLTPDERQQWIDMVVPNHEKLISQTGGRAQELWDIIQKGKRACKK